MRILIVRLGAMGDIIHSLPLAADLHAAGHHLDWLCEERWAPLLRGNPLLERVHGLPRRCSWSLYRSNARSLRQYAYDAVIDAQGLAKSALWLALIGPRLRIGFAPPRSRECAFFFASTRLAALGVHVVDQQRSLARGLGIRPQGPPRCPLPAWPQQHAWAAAWCAAQGLHRPWALNVGAGWPSKVWPQEMQVEFVRLAQTKGRRVLVLWGSERERILAESLCAGQDHAICAPATDIPQLAGLLACAAVCVSGDTGPLHLAAALQCPTVGLFGPVPCERNGPRGRAHHNLQAQSPAWERRRAERVDWSALSPAVVYQEAEKIARQ